MWHQRRIAVVVPAYNEERLIGKTLASIPDFVDAVFLVDDDSDDHTAEVALGLGDSRVRVIAHGENRGVGAAIATGYLAALDDGADVLVVMAGDAQMDAQDMPALLAPVVSGRVDYAKGNRFRHPDRRRMPLPRRTAGKALSALTRRATGFDIDDSQCGFTALSRRAATRLPLAELWPRYGYPNDLLGLLSAEGCTVTDVPVRPVYADETSGVRPWHALTVAFVVARRFLKTKWLDRRSRP